MSTSTLDTDPLVARHVRELFRRLPRVSGFRLGADLSVTEVAACTGPDGSMSRGLYRMVVQAIVELVECHPDIADQLRGRAFVRCLH